MKPAKLKLGALKAMFEVADDFDALLPEFKNAFYGSPRKHHK
jgi:hypothetical protein